jgi:hypothetical protein
MKKTRKALEAYKREQIEEVNDRWAFVGAGQRNGAGCSRHLFTVFLKTPDCERGEYADEIDVCCTTQTQAKRIAITLIECGEYQSDCTAARVVWGGRS